MPDAEVNELDRTLVEGGVERDVGVTTAPEVWDGTRAAVDGGDPDEVGSEDSKDVDDVWILFERFGVVVGLGMIPLRCERTFIVQFAQELSVSQIPQKNTEGITHRCGRSGANCKTRINLKIRR